VNDCVFCRIVSGEIPAAIISRTDRAVAFRDLDPKAPTHVLIVPLQHLGSARDASGEEGAQLLGHLVQFATKVATEQALDERGYRLVMNTGPDAGQSVAHLHLHLLGGRAMHWPPG
jgi:histidine triad (HIT) family protein